MAHILGLGEVDPTLRVRGKIELRERYGAKIAGVLGLTVCLPDNEGEYHPYAQVVDPNPPETGWKVATNVNLVDCPVFRANRCNKCPNRSLINIPKL